MCQFDLQLGMRGQLLRRGCHRSRHRSALLALVLAQAVAVPVFAADDEPAQLQEVVVTGSRIRQTDQGALPVSSISAQQIDQTGAVNPEQIFQSISVAVQGNNNTVAASAAGATTGGVTSVSLRGLGSQRTLVLLNGKRVAGGGTITDSTSVDINSIPLAALERVDVLKDSASAVYGSDAIGGVVNFIVRDNFEGLQASGYGGGTTDGGGDVKRATLLAGLGNLSQDRFNVLFSANYQKENPLYGNQRDFAKSGINVGAGNDATSGNTFPANVVPLDGSFGTVNPNAPDNCAPSVSDPLNHPTTRCRYDPSPFVALLPAAERYSLYTAGHFALTPDVQLYGDLSYTQNRTRVIIQPVPLSDQFALPSNNPLFNIAPYNGNATINLAPTSPYYPTAFVQSITGGPTPVLDVFYRDVASGNRDLTDTSKAPRATFGIKGTTAGWDFDANLLYSQTQLTEVDNGGYPAYTKILPLLNSGLINFFGPTTDPAIVAEALAANYDGVAYKTKTTLAEAEVSASREVVTLPAGPLSLAVDGSFRKERFQTYPSAAIQSGDISGYGGNFFPQDVQRNVAGASLELQVPIIGTLVANPAVRYDHYQGTGQKTTPKIGLRWRPIDEVLLRGSYSKGFRAPSLTELYQPVTKGVSSPGLSDPARCAITGSSFDCSTQFNTTLGGNTLLKPETSDTFTVGFVVQPVQGLSIGVDAFSIKLKNTIIFGVDPAAILADPALFGSLITRGAPTANCPGCPGPITTIAQTNTNFGETDVKGFDLEFSYKYVTPSFGTFTLSTLGSYFATYREEQPDGTFLNVAGKVSPITNGAGGAIPRWHHFATLSWELTPWQVAISENYQSSYEDLPSTVSGDTRTVGSYSTVDLQGAWTGIEHLKLAVGARNLFNQNPPYSNVGGQNVFQAGYDPGYADPRGLFIYGTVTYSLDFAKK